MGNRISKILAAIFGVILLGAVVGMDFVTYSREPGSTGASGYAAAARSRLRAFIDAPPPVLLADHLPAAPQGWDRRIATQTDAEALTGRPFDKRNPAPDLTHAIAKRLLLSARDDSRLSEVYARGPSLIALHIEVTPAGKEFSTHMKLARRAEAKLRASLLSDAVYLDASGLVFRSFAPVNVDPATGAQTPVAYRRFWAEAEGRLAVELVTNATDEDILPILLGLDSAALLAMGAAPGPATAAPDPANPVSAMPDPGDLATVQPTSAPAPAEPPASGPCIRRAGTLVCD